MLALIVPGTMVAGVVDPALMFMICTAIALALNYPQADLQRARIEAHAKAVVTMAAHPPRCGRVHRHHEGIGDADRDGDGGGGLFWPFHLAPHIPVVLAVLSMPLSLLFDPDLFDLGALPVIALVAGRLGMLRRSRSGRLRSSAR